MPLTIGAQGAVKRLENNGCNARHAENPSWLGVAH